MKIRNYFLLCKVLWKQYLYKHRIWLLVLLLLAFILRFVNPMENKDEFVGYIIGICASDDEGKALLGQLQNHEGIFEFCEYEDEKVLLRDVKNGTLECGYVLPEDFLGKLSDGKMRHQITLYHSSASVVHKLSYEVVFSHLFEMLSDITLEKWIEEGTNGVLLSYDRDIRERLKQWKENYESGDSTFSFIFEQVGRGRTLQENRLDIVRGIVGVAIFFLALLGFANCDEVSLKMTSFTIAEAKRLEAIARHIAVTSSVVAGGLFLVIAGRGTEPVKELLGLFFYFVTLELFLWILKFLLPKKEAVYGAIPVLLLGSILFCPVFFQMEAYFPVAGYLGKIFPPYWYLSLFI